jgi:hypothetical protein
MQRLCVYALENTRADDTQGQGSREETRTQEQNFREAGMAF